MFLEHFCKVQNENIHLKTSLDYHFKNRFQLKINQIITNYKKKKNTQELR